MAISIGSVNFDGPGEDQIDWVDQLWSPVGQSKRYSLSCDINITENARGARPITLEAKLPWAWLEAGTVDSLLQISSVPGQIYQFVFGSTTKNVIFDRSQGPLALNPINPLRQYFTGTIYLIEV